ncbi:LCP family protein [Streptomyces caniscabiei]|uniref:LCP family protein n=1 Tax=Streptomyces caniscabiei TaxID=2746961 RepID=UPI0029AF373E|nr:LCP family protein [Streptomyces caniscabiei]MDX2776232.1 LCP family protein [Streptomyces caniscabiei]
MTKQQPSLDGFVPRRPGSQLGDLHPGSIPKVPHADRPLTPQPQRQMQSPTGLRPVAGVTRTDLDESLKGIDLGDDSGKKGTRKKKSPNRRRRIIKWSIIVFILIILGVGGYLLYKALGASNQIFKGNPLDIIQNQPLKEDANGRSNILVFGTSEDDPEHGGADLTDSIMVLSVNQKKKDAYMVSIPRDLYVDYSAACPEGMNGKINSLYSCFAGDGDEAAGAAALQKKVGEVLGLDIQYYAHLNYTAVREAVDAVGGIDVTIESEDPRGILDRNFDWKCNYDCYFVNYKNGETVHLDGEHALALARARNAAGGYGLPNGNFDREKNQQKIIKALREKAVSAGTLANISKVSSLLDALGNNLRTNFETKEIRTLMSLGNDIKSDNIKSVSLVEEGDMQVTTGNINGASIVQPVAGLFDYSGIHAYVSKIINANDITKEGAKVVVLNGSGVAGKAQEEADALTAEGFTITAVDNAPSDVATTEIYQIGEGMSATKAKLESLYGVKVTAGTPPADIAEGTNFVVIIGPSAQAQ